MYWVSEPMKPYTLTKTDLGILFLFLVAFVIIGLTVWLLPIEPLRSLQPVVPIMLAVVLFLLIRRHDRLVEHQSRWDDYRQMEAWIALQRFINPRLPLSGLRGGALSPDAAVILCRELLTKKPKLVVECGAGISTLIVGYLLKDLGGGELITIEHDLEWQERVNSWIELHDLGDYVTVLHAPLIDQKLDIGPVYWYDISEFETIMRGKYPASKRIDLLFVDGPPVFIDAYVRRPALYFMRQWFAPHCSIIVDDTNRPADADIVRQWCKVLEASCECEWYATEKGTALIRIISQTHA